MWLDGANDLPPAAVIGIEEEQVNAVVDISPWAGFAHYLRHRRLLEESTVIAYRTALNRLLRHAGITDLTELKVSDLEDYLGAPGYSWSAKQQTLIAYRMFRRWGARHGRWVLDQHIEEIRLRRRPNPTSKALTDIQVYSLLHSPLRAIEVRIVYLGLYAGLRISGMADVREENWHVDSSGIDIIKIHEKGKTREIPVHKELARMRSTILCHEASDRMLKRAVVKLRKYVGDQAFTSHWLRHTFGVTLSKKGIERDVVAELLGHAPVGTTASTYVPVRWDEEVHAMSVLEYGSGQLALFG